MSPYDPNQMNKPGFTPRFLSEYSMGQLDFLRYQDHLKFIEKLAGEINSCDIPELQQCQQYFAGLNTLYKLWRPLLGVKVVTEGLDKALAEAKIIKRRWESNHKQNAPFGDPLKLKMVDILDAFHTRLMRIKQVIGLGITVKRNMSTREKIKAGVKGYSGSKFDLPAP